MELEFKSSQGLFTFLNTVVFVTEIFYEPSVIILHSTAPKRALPQQLQDSVGLPTLRDMT